MSEDNSASEPEVRPELAEILVGMDTLELQRAVEHVQTLLHERTQEMQTEIEAGPGEEIVRVTDKGAYTEVVKRQPCAEGCPDCPHEPYLYHVRVEKRPDGERHLHWTLIGRVFD